MTIAQRIAAFFAAAFSLGAPAVAMPSDNPRLSALDKAVDTAVGAEFGGPCHVGLSLAVVRGERVGFYNYGSISRTMARVPKATSIYEIASVTKTFTGALAARAIEDGKFSLDGDFRLHLPDKYPNLAWQRRPITLRALATHRSGLPRDIPDTDAIFARRDFATLPSDLIAAEKDYDRARYLAELHGIALRSAPGKAFIYSNIGMKLIGFGLESAYRVPFATVMARAILEPLHMEDTDFDVPAAKRARLVTGHGRDGAATPYHLANAGAAYGLYSTPADMAKYVRWQLDERSTVIRRAHAPLIGDDSEGEALIWNLARDHGARMLWHGGGTFGMSSEVMLYPETAEGYVLLANDSCAGTEQALKAIASRLHGARRPRRG